MSLPEFYAWLGAGLFGLAAFAYVLAKLIGG